MKKTFLLVILCLFVFSLDNEVFAEVKDHPVIKPIPGSTLDSHHSQYNNYNAYIFRYKENNMSAAVAYDGLYKVVIFGFPFETITSEESRFRTMKAVFNFFNSKPEK